MENLLSDDKVKLVRNELLSENSDLTLSQAECFDIYDIESNKIVGLISYRYLGYDKIDYFGNINYRIKEEYRGNGYAKRALSIMLNILKYNTKFDEDLYVASIPSNRNYLNVAKECGGQLIFSGEAPNSVIGKKFDTEMKYVEVYKFNIEKVNNKLK